MIGAGVPEQTGGHRHIRCKPGRLRAVGL